MPHVYILECADGSYYTGSTFDLERRLAEHEQGLAANFTRKHLPVKPVFCEFSDSVELVFRREKQIQGWSRAKKRALIESRLNDLPTLASRKRNPGPGAEPLRDGPGGPPQDRNRSRSDTPVPEEVAQRPSRRAGPAQTHPSTRPVAPPQGPRSPISRGDDAHPSRR